MQMTFSSTFMRSLLQMTFRDIFKVGNQHSNQNKLSSHPLTHTYRAACKHTHYPLFHPEDDLAEFVSLAGTLSNPPPPLPSSSAGHGDSRPVGGSAMCHTLHGSAGEEDWHRACVTLAQFDVLCPRTGTTVGGIAMCHNHHHPLLCRISPHMCVPVCVCVCFCIAIL